MKKQKIPRKILTEGFRRSVYDRYGNNPDNFSKNDYITSDQNYRNDLSLEFNGGFSNKHFKKLIEISKTYYKWIENFNNDFLFK